jgi:tetratricopeptide (TPR) repeat protein
MKTKAHRILTIIFLLSVFLLALNNIHDPDAWLHLSHGKLLWEEKALPKNEAFIYPNAENPHLYTSWLFGLVCYASYLILGQYGPSLLKAVLVSIAFLILFRDSIRPYRNHALAAIVLTGAVFISQQRFVLRPDILLMSFLPLSIFCLNAYLYENKKYIYALPLVHLLWANCHSSINLMIVPFVAFIAGGILQQQLSKRGIGTRDAPSPSQLKVIAVVFIASIASSLINPNFTGLYLFGYDILSIAWWKDEVVELLPPSGTILILLWIIIGIIALSFILNRKQLSTIHLLTVIPFLVPPFTSRRFILILIVIGAPIVIRNFSAFLKSNDRNRLFRGKTATAITAACIILYFTLALAKVEPFAEKNRDFGFGFDYSLMPKGAVEYMDSKDIQGRVLNTFHFGQYIIWTGYPKRTVFIDGRGYLPDDLLEESNTFRYIKSVLDDLYSKYGFESILIKYPKRLSDIELTLKPPEWALVYWDDMSLLYLKRGGKYDSIIGEDEYKYVMPYISFASFNQSLGNKENQLKIAGELKRNIAEIGSSHALTLLGLLYSSTSRHKEAIDVVQPLNSYTTHLIMGDSYRKLGDIDASLRHYRKALDIEKNAVVMYKIGAIYLSKGETKRAEKYISNAVRLKSDLAYAYPLLFDIYQRLGKAEEAEKAKKEYRMQLALKSASRHFESGEKAYHEKRYAAALEDFNKALAITPSDPVIHTDLGYVYYDMGQLDKSHEHFAKALELNPSPSNATRGLRLPNAFYGLGLLYIKAGDRETAIENFKKYIKTEPSGFYSRSAKKMIRDLSQR